MSDIMRSPQSSVLLLPPPPRPATGQTLKAAYSPALTATLETIASLRLPTTAILEVVVPCSSFPQRLEEPRSVLFKEAEHILAGIYSLICIICAKKSIDPDGPGGVDARVILVAYDPSHQLSIDHDLPTIPTTVSGPIVDLFDFANSRRQWHHIFRVDGEQGEAIFNSFVKIAKRNAPPMQGEIHTVSGGIALLSQSSDNVEEPERELKVHKVVAVGGTFDHLHAGHKLLLTATALLLQPPTGSDKSFRRLIVGITGDELLKNKKYATYLESWKKRQENVVEFLLSILSFPLLTPKEEVETTTFDEPVVNGKAIHTSITHASIIIECVEIQDPFGPTITDESVTALVVSGETRGGGAAVNTEREKKGWKSLEVFEVGVLDAEDGDKPVKTNEDFAAKISSTAARKRKAESAQGPSL